MRRAQYVSQKVVREDDVYRLTDAEQDQFIAEVAKGMAREMEERTKGARPIGDVAFTVVGPHNDPIQGLIHVHTISAWYDLDKVAADAPFRLDFIQAHGTENSGEGTIG